jgi:hypothetical protein
VYCLRNILIGYSFLEVVDNFIKQDGIVDGIDPADATLFRTGPDKIIR